MSNNHYIPCQYSIRLINKLRSLDTENILDFNLIDKSIFWVKKYHDGQFRNSGEPFYTHPLEVAYLISDYSLNNDVIIASILHDIVEDTEVTLEMLLDTFGGRIAEIVERLTRDQPDGSKLSVAEIINNAYRLKDKDVLLIKLIDRLHNMHTLGAKTPDKVKKTTDETLYLFILTCMYTGYIDLEKIMYKLCCDNLSINAPIDMDFHLADYSASSSFLENVCIPLSVSQVFQNVTTPLKSTEQ